MNCKFLKLAIIPALLIGIACSSQQRTAANANTTNTRAASYKDGIKKALEQADLKDVNEDKNKNVINLSGTLHSENAKLRAGEIAQAAAGNRVIANEISVQPLGTESPARQINTNTDSAIEKNYKAALISKGLNKEHIRFKAKNGVLTLQGSVKTPQERREAQQIAANIPNVQQVLNEIQVNR
jgi:osmotically-inducible protein OsmY